MRINRYLASCGLGARRKCEELVIAGRVKVDGIRANLTTLVNGEVTLDGKVIKPSQFVYIVLNKPKGYVTTCDDERGRRTVLDLVNVGVRIFPVGRLDYNTEGLLILTNDGEFAKRMTHPSSGIEKTYIVKLDKEIMDLSPLRKGVLGYQSAKAKKMAPKVVELVICEGKNRQVRKMFEALGFRVVSLKRIKVGEIELGDLGLGEWRHLDKSFVE